MNAKNGVDPQKNGHHHAAAHAPKVAVLGYGPDAREHALALRAAGHDVAVGVRPGGMSSVRARGDGFAPACASAAVRGADVVMVLVPGREQASLYGHAIAPCLAPGALVVFDGALALATGALAAESTADVVLVTGERREGGRARARVAVWHDATGRAIERAITTARALFGASALVGTTTFEAELETALAQLEREAGGAAELYSAVESSASRARDSHAPEEAEVAYYDGLEELVGRRFEASRAPVSAERGSTPSLRSSAAGTRRSVA